MLVSWSSGAIRVEQSVDARGRGGGTGYEDEARNSDFPMNCDFSRVDIVYCELKLQQGLKLQDVYLTVTDINVGNLLSSTRSTLCTQNQPLY